MTRDELFALPLDDYTAEAIKRKRNESLPPPGIFRSPLWEFTRLMKARSEFTFADGYTAAIEVEKVLRQLCSFDDNDLFGDDGVDPWQHHFGELPDVDDPRAEFIDTWDKVRTPANMDVLTTAWEKAKQLPLQPIRPYSPNYSDLLSIAGHLQCARRDRPIALPVERIAEILGCTRQTVSRCLRFALREGLLTTVSGCVPHQKAAEYKFKTDRFDWSSGRQLR